MRNLHQLLSGFGQRLFNQTISFLPPSTRFINSGHSGFWNVYMRSSVCFLSSSDCTSPLENPSQTLVLSCKALVTASSTSANAPFLDSYSLVPPALCCCLGPLHPLLFLEGLLVPRSSARFFRFWQVRRHSRSGQPLQQPPLFYSFSLQSLAAAAPVTLLWLDT